MGNRLRLGAPRLERSANGVRLCVDTNWTVGGAEYAHSFYYEAEEAWARYFVTERSDAFVLAFLEVAMEHGCDLEFSAALSEDLKYQLERYLIPVYAARFEMLREIALRGPAAPGALPSVGATGTGFSGGVDSFYTVLTHLRTGLPGKDVTHLLLAVNGSALTGIDPELDEEWFCAQEARLRPLAEEMGLELVGVRSNLPLLNGYKRFAVGGDHFVTAGFVHALGKLFGTYYWASAYSVDVFEFNPVNCGYTEHFSLPLLNVYGGVHFYFSGQETSRIGKLRAIADHPLAQRGLTVCGHPVNCGRCEKCLRTMAELYAIGKLENFRAVFPVDDFRAHLSSRLAEEFTGDDPLYLPELRSELRASGQGIPLAARVKRWLWFEPLYFFKRKLRNSALAKRLYYRLGLRRLLFGLDTDARVARARMEGRGKLK